MPVGIGLRMMMAAAGRNAPLPLAPSDLVATPATTTQIDLSWTDNSSDEDGFKIERSLDEAIWSQIAIVPAGVTTHQDSGLSPSTAYYYRVRAYSATGTSGPSNTASAVTDSPATPSAFLFTDTTAFEFTDAEAFEFTS